MCCKVPAVPALNKPRNVWCVNCLPGRGCGIYESRPDICRSFFCEWMLTEELGPEWKPDAAKFVMLLASDGNLNILVDPGYANAWKDNRYYPRLKTTATWLIERGRLIIVLSGAEKIVILPDRDERLRIPDDWVIGVRPRISPQGVTTYEVLSQPVAASV
ncbi:MAG: hypothetical protein K2X62_01535 [Beijerinckiaceae bacterium]|jgi:hypothetical protein|nr:hypothetical protein [Beijerinckiaceae bacterium]MDO9440101.1 hypothetical protein [Beijerinckiaceae bacterium]